VRIAAAVLAVLALAGCASAPAYRRPAVEIPAAWKVQAPWRESVPNDAAARGPWWHWFADPQLDALEQRALAASPTLALAAARLAQARASVDAASAGLFPQVALTGRASRAKISANRPLSSYTSPNFSTVQNESVLSFTVNYEADLWGRVRHSIESAQASAQQSAADFENVRLVLASDLAANYFNLRELDIELDVVV
jgi:outer membrane protein, multidrug efflux system